MIEEGIYNLLTTCVPLQGLVADRVTPVILPKSPVLPAVTFYAVSDRTLLNVDSTALMYRSIEVNIWAKTYLDAKHGQALIHDLLDGFSGTLSDGTRVLETSSSDNPDFFEKDSSFFRASTTFVFLT